MKVALLVILLIFSVTAGAAPDAASVVVNVNSQSNAHPFSPLIFGVAFADDDHGAQVGYTVNRWGGNSTSRYNWRGPAHNAGNDYFFLGYGSDQTDSADDFITRTRSYGAQVLLSVPTIGWVQKFDPANPTQVTWGFSEAKYGVQTLDECRYYSPQPSWCHGDAGNGICNGTSAHCSGGKTVGNTISDTSVANAPSDDAAWIASLQATYGTAANGGVKLYSLDNEVMLWNSTHRDVHPVPPTYDEIWSKAQAYATAIKTQDPTALVTGPVTWGYPDLFTSAKDAADCNCPSGTDRAAHGGLAFVPWFLQQTCAASLPGGKRLIDYLDLHYYPQGTDVALSSDDSTNTAALRLRSLKELYDPSYTSESWIGQIGAGYNEPDLIHRVRAWIDSYCAGTKLAITEYNWGNDDTSSGAVAQAEVLAIFAREGVDMATRWVAPSTGSKVQDAFTLYLNYDGAGSKVTGNSVAASSVSVDVVGAYAFFARGQRLMLMLTNKDTVAHDVTLNFERRQSGTWKLFAFDATHTLRALPTGNVAGKSLTLSNVAAMSANLLVIPDDTIAVNGFE